ncbi:hypothetical protein Taro_000397 [Colocasia esculenta]|uniref:Uncharacterized protein n=1 Tax=Colocasia esculenta TaxID=4460 RepID=A0A843T705_COLES|nr:hypothetical protein [Colocasia esculenta]
MCSNSASSSRKNPRRSFKIRKLHNHTPLMAQLLQLMIHMHKYLEKIGQDENVELAQVQPQNLCGVVYQHKCNNKRKKFI